VSPRTRILIADDHPLVREALSRVFSNQKDMEVVGEAADGEEAVEMASRLKPDVLVMDIMMPKVDGLEATRRIKRLVPNVAILILTAYDDDSYVLGLLEAGAAGYLMKSARGQDLVEAVRSIHAGESVLHPRIIEKLLRRAVTGSVKVEEKKVVEDFIDKCQQGVCAWEEAEYSVNGEHTQDCGCVS
jgi:NarL family two-component system response regulator LiaR